MMSENSGSGTGVDKSNELDENASCSSKTLGDAEKNIMPHVVKTSAKGDEMTDAITVGSTDESSDDYESDGEDDYESEGGYETDEELATILEAVCAGELMERNELMEAVKCREYIDCPRRTGENPLTCAVMSHTCALEMTTFLIEQGADVNYYNIMRNRSVLHIACMNFRAQDGLLELLLDNGACMDVVDFRDRTPLSVVLDNYAIWPNARAALVLLRHGSPVNSEELYSVLYYLILREGHAPDPETHIKILRIGIYVQPLMVKERWVKDVKSLKELLSQPLTLIALSRRKVRDCCQLATCGSSIKSAINSLPIPITLKDYLMFADL